MGDMESCEGHGTRHITSSTTTPAGRSLLPRHARAQQQRAVTHWSGSFGSPLPGPPRSAAAAASAAAVISASCAACDDCAVGRVPSFRATAAAWVPAAAAARAACAAAARCLFFTVVACCCLSFFAMRRMLRRMVEYQWFFTALSVL